MTRSFSTRLPMWKSGDRWRHAASTTWCTKQRKSSAVERSKKACRGRRKSYEKRKGTRVAQQLKKRRY